MVLGADEVREALKFHINGRGDGGSDRQPSTRRDTAQRRTATIQGQTRRRATQAGQLAIAWCSPVCRPGAQIDDHVAHGWRSAGSCSSALSTTIRAERDVIPRGAKTSG
jgi:hypothetical protein